VAHTKGDTGGEFVAAFEFPLSFLLADGWYVPVRDLVHIFDYAPSFVNKSVTPAAIEECQALFFAGSWAIRTFGADVFQEQVVDAQCVLSVCEGVRVCACV
jgi:hypothetical protein